MIPSNRAILGSTLAIALCLSLSCRRLPRDASQPALPRATWWNFYTRGIEFSRRNEWDNAIRDLETAMGKRKGAIFPDNQEKRRAKTYGLHFLDNYFPHRELGVCLFHQGRFDAAEAELLVSLKMLPSSRASFYLNQVRRERLSRQQEQPRAGRVRIDLPFPEGTLFTRKPYIDLDGNATSPDYVSEISANGEALFVELAARSVLLRHRAKLSSGRQELVITARDLAGGETTWRRPVVVDLSGPSISIARDPSAPKQNVLLSVTDDYELATVTINGAQLTILPGTSTVTQTVPLTGRRNVIVTATDRAGNSTNWTRRVRDLLKASLDSLRHHPNVQLAMAPLRTSSLHISAGALLATPGKEKKHPDTDAPRLLLLPEIAGECTVTTELYVLDLEVEDRGLIDSIAVTVGGRHE